MGADARGRCCCTGSGSIGADASSSCSCTRAGSMDCKKGPQTAVPEEHYFQVWHRDYCGCVSCYMGAWRALQFASWALRKVGSVEYVGRGGRMRYVPRNMRRQQGWIETATARLSAEGSARPVCLVCICPFFVNNNSRFSVCWLVRIEIAHLPPCAATQPPILCQKFASSQWL